MIQGRHSYGLLTGIPLSLVIWASGCSTDAAPSSPSVSGKASSQGGASGVGGTNLAGGAPSAAGAGPLVPSFGGMTSSGGSVSSGSGGQEASAGGANPAGGAALGGASTASSQGGSLSVGGRTTSGGSAGTASSSGGQSGADADGFTLLFRDEFNELDLARWQLMSHSWDSNLALFSTEAVTIESGQLALRLLPAPAGTVDDSNARKQFLGAEVRSKQTITYGRVRGRIQFAAGSAVVSSLVTIYTPWPADNWNEIDIECLGQPPTSTQLNVMVYTGPAVTPPVTQSVVPTQDPAKVELGFDPAAAFHVYEMEWTPESVRFLVDEKLVRTWTARIDRLTLPQNVLLTIWASASADWAGAITSETGRAKALFDWVELYSYTPTAPSSPGAP